MLGVMTKFRGLDAGLGGLKGLIRVVRTRSSVVEQRGGGIGSHSLACFSAWPASQLACVYTWCTHGMWLDVDWSRRSDD